MLHLSNRPLTPQAASELVQYQQQVDAQPTFPEKVAEAKRLFPQKNKEDNPPFQEVRELLRAMSGATIRCNYCEDSAASEVEHIYPKHFYPEKCFVWENYCYACGPCNRPKGNNFAVFEAATSLEKNLKTDIPADSPPPPGQALLIDPRTEDPLKFLFLDTINTFYFTPSPNLSPNDKRRAEFTIKLLGLNTRTHLVRARKNAFVNFKARLFEYVSKKESGTPPASLIDLEVSFRSEQHQTVWREMIRQRTFHREIDDLLNRAPEALHWL